MTTSGSKKEVTLVDSKNREPTIEELRRELDAEQKSKDTVEWSNLELERSVRAMEANVIALESGNADADDSEAKRKYDNQKQLNAQLQEQKRWLEHELEQVIFVEKELDPSSKYISTNLGEAQDPE